MPKEDAVANLTIKVSHQDMLDYTDDLYLDIANPAINGIDTHSLDEAPHNLPARFAAVYSEIDRIDTELANKLDVVNIDGKADVAGDTFTGTVIFAGGDEATVIDGPEQSDRSVYARTDGVNRWEMQIASNDDELGANSGSNFAISRYGDSGEFLGTPFAIDRKTGTVLVDSLQVGGGEIIVGAGVDVRVQELEPTENITVGTVWIKPSGDSGGVPPGVPSLGLLTHLSASSLALNDGDVVGSIPDSSGNNNDATSIGTINYVASDTPNGSPSVKNAIGGYMTLPPTLYSGKGAGHVFIYLSRPQTSAARGPVNLSDSAGDSDTWCNETTMKSSTFITSVGSMTFTPSPSVNNSWRIIEYSNTSSVTKVYIDGALQSSQSSGFATNDNPRLFTNGGGSSDGIWHIADVIAYDRELSSGEAAAVRDYLEAKNGPTGPLPAVDPQYAAVMALSPVFYLPLQSDYNDYSGGNNHATYSRGGISIARVPETLYGPSSHGHLEIGTTYNDYSLEASVPAVSNDGMSVSWWASRKHSSTADSWSRFNHQIGSGPDVLSIIFKYSTGLEITHGGYTGTWGGALGNRDVVDHYAITIENNTGRPTRLYFNGAEVSTSTGHLGGKTFSGTSYFFKKGAGDTLGDGYGSQFALFNKTLTPAEVLSLSNARLAV